MSGFTTPEQDRRFHVVADQFDRSTRRQVQRAVAKGEPPLDEQLRPLALIYLERLERSAADTKSWLRPLFIGLGMVETLLAILSWLVGGVSLPLDISLTVSGPCYVLTGLLQPKNQATRNSQLQRSRALVMGNPIGTSEP